MKGTDFTLVYIMLIFIILVLLPASTYLEKLPSKPTPRASITKVLTNKIKHVIINSVEAKERN